MEKAWKIIALLFFILILLLTILYFSVTIHPTQKISGESKSRFWQYQCIDTMKISRDNARKWLKKTDLQNHISWEMRTIKSLGANCVAIDTPYDEEFIPYLTLWVQEARNQQLSIWFRGNFAGWEQWFEYPKLASTNLFFTKLENFIYQNASLFEDGDIFTGAPEAENGGPFNQVEKDEYRAYRQFLIDEYNIEKNAFEKIHKNVALDWQSMNGGLARRMLDDQTIQQMNKVVTLDHYIKTAPEMTEYISYFHNTFNAKVNIGEFGAPIPDINGSMSEDEQASFVEELFVELYRNREIVNGINYWDLYDGSTALYNPDTSPRKVVSVIKKYFLPAIIEGYITNDFDEPIPNVYISNENNSEQILSDVNGRYSILTVEPSITLHFSHKSNNETLQIDNITPGQEIKRDIQFKDKNMNIFDKTRLYIYKLKKGK